MKPAPLLTVGVLALIASIAVSTQPPTDPHLPVPAGFDSPADEAALLKLRDAADVSGMRRHSWLVFAGMTQPAPSGEALWETWWPEEQTFATALPFSAGRQRPRLKAPRQMGPRPRVASAQAAGESGLAFVAAEPRVTEWVTQEPGRRRYRVRIPQSVVERLYNRAVARADDARPRTRSRRDRPKSTRMFSLVT